MSAVARQKIPGLTHRTYHIGRERRQRIFAQRNDLVVRAVERRPDQIVHGGVHNHEFLVSVLLAVEHAREQHAGRADDGTAGLHHDMQPARAQTLLHAAHKTARFRARFFARVISDAKAAAQIEMADGVTRGAQAARQFEHLVDSFQYGSGIENLRADMAAHAFGREVAEALRALVNGGAATMGMPNL